MGADKHELMKSLHVDAQEDPDVVRMGYEQSVPWAYYPPCELNISCSDCILL